MDRLALSLRHIRDGTADSSWRCSSELTSTNRQTVRRTGRRTAPGTVRRSCLPEMLGKMIEECNPEPNQVGSLDDDQLVCSGAHPADTFNHKTFLASHGSESSLASSVSNCLQCSCPCLLPVPPSAPRGQPVRSPVSGTVRESTRRLDRSDGHELIKETQAWTSCVVVLLL